MKTILAAAAAAALSLGIATPSYAGFSPQSFLSIFAPQPQSQAQVQAVVSVSQQRMDVTVVTGSGEVRTYHWKVSTGRSGYGTPTGAFQPTWLDIDHKSNEYDDTPMPYAVFFQGGYAIHATTAVARLGTPASHGCVRLAPQNAALFYDLVHSYGKWNTKIVITD